VTITTTPVGNPASPARYRRNGSSWEPSETPV
jgi:hypothetical protein